ncbi:DUF2254 domain-containing protein [Arthrobacter sp. B3I4]|uniref:DUF2254 domain-containing protein n=1 Tax=Arthrobacter sp. B3I4 TaxID=3042267 RepID=UPI00277D413F|nr:DUF2254 domain-containing protein [Arthrobacter sp. B3I4]MDQ0756400.1 putative membrane protein [Arthrobacter sp. B3I4]
MANGGNRGPARGDGRVARWMEALRSQLWPLPVAAVVAAVAVGTALPALDAAVDDQVPDTFAVLLFTGGPEAARAVLQAISGSLITVTSLTFSLTVVTLQLASSQFSPRLLRTFSSDRFVHATLALFLAAFAFALTVLRSVRAESAGGTQFVPAISVTVAFALAMASVIGLVLFLAHLTREIRVETMMRLVNQETQQTMERVFPLDRPVRAPLPPPGPGAFRIRSARSGFLTSLDRASLLDAAVTARMVVRLDYGPGSSLVRGVPFATAWPDAPGTAVRPDDREKLGEAVAASIVTGFERTNVQDVGFGFRQLVDVAVRALSPGINDPTTAVHVIGHLSVLLCSLVERDPGPELLTDDDGRVRAVIAFPGFEELLDAAVDQPTHYGMADAAVAARLLTLLQEISWCDQSGRYRGAILEHRERMCAAIRAGDYFPAERRRLLKLAEAVGSIQAGN